MSEPRGPSQALIRLFDDARLVHGRERHGTGQSTFSVGDSARSRPRRASSGAATRTSDGSRWRAVGCCAQASTIMRA
ncbi:MAG: hypothetical protein MZW92_09775 [Comamonadaceae bacterium]|nr:hypothetical protein [Comamonadaceae bacterium]